VDAIFDVVKLALGFAESEGGVVDAFLVPILGSAHPAFHFLAGVVEVVGCLVQLLQKIVGNEKDWLNHGRMRPRDVGPFIVSIGAALVAGTGKIIWIPCNWGGEP
jgi:hypothetical protein